MGSKQTKIDGSYLPDTPQILTRISAHPGKELQNPIDVQTVFGSDESGAANALDPRSPNSCRTPIRTLYKYSTTTVQQQIEVHQQQTPFNNYGDNPLSLFRKRFLRGFSSNLHDPRSPSSNLTRTPLVFDENDKTLNLDDTFSDLFVESKTPAEPHITEQSTEAGQMQVKEETDTVKINVSAEAVTEIRLDSPLESNDKALETSSFCYEEVETMPCPDILQQTPNVLHQQLDPRSPTFGVERTPIIFADDDEASEDAMLENILATLSLNLSTGSSIASFGSPVFGREEGQIDKIAAPIQLMDLSIKPTNKHLDRVRTAKKRAPMRKTIVRSQRHRIYEDCENTPPSKTTSVNTPRSKVECSPRHSSISSSVNKRTPLSCVKNRSHLRSRSVESSAKSLKERLALTSFDDILNPVQNPKVTNLRIMVGGTNDSLKM